MPSRPGVRSHRREVATFQAFGSPKLATFVGGKKGRKSNYSQGDPPDSHMNKAIISRARFTPDDFFL
ncbi:hypothetical protein E4U40_001867, partial [Claviceps sp. LM458 group G5]